MKNLTISVSELELTKFGIINDKLTFSEFVDIISKEMNRQTLIKCMELSERYGLSKMTMSEITKEVKAVRKNAKNHT